MNLMRGGMMFSQKDVVLIPFPYSDLTGVKKRPALILSNKLLQGNDKICCLITSNPETLGLEIKKDFFDDGKLPFKSWIKPERLFTINVNIIKKKLCSINEDFHNIVIGKINDFLKLSSE